MNSNDQTDFCTPIRLALWCVLSLLLAGGCQLAPVNALDRELEEIRALLPGTYAGTASAPWNSEQQIGLTHEFVEVSAPQFGDLVYYYQLGVDGKVTQEKLFVFDTSVDRSANSMSPILLATDAAQANLRKHPDSRAQFSAKAATVFPERCRLIWTPRSGGQSNESDDGQGFSATVTPQRCEYESEAFAGSIRPFMRYEIDASALGWEERLVDANDAVLAETQGRLLATREVQTPENIAATAKLPAPDQVWTNANIITLDPVSTRAEALAIRDGRILAVGSDRAIVELADDNTERHDLAGQTVLPGFIDAHGHFPFGKIRAERANGRPTRWADRLVDVNSPPIGDIESIDQLLDRLRAQVALLEPGQWLQAIGYDDTLLREQRHLTRHDLDRVSTVHPIYVSHISGHAAVGNSLALELGKITSATPQPAGGHIYKDPETGEPTGLLEEMSAMGRVSNKIPRIRDDELVTAAEVNAKAYAAVGVTTAQMGAAGIASINPFLKAYEQGRLPIRVQVWPVVFEAAPLAAKGELWPEIPDTNGFVRYGATKAFADGSIQAYSGYLREPYHQHSKNDPDYRGYPAMNREALQKILGRMHKAGYQLAIHGNGDAAIDDILLVLEQAQAEHPREDARHIIIHAQMATREQLARMSRLGAIPSFFNLHVYYWGDRHRDVFLGPQRAAGISSLAAAQALGLPFTLHADSPVVPMDPLMMIWSAVTRETTSGTVLGKDERITAEQALRAITINAAYQSFEEDSKGSIEPGKLADLVVLDADPTAVEPHAIKDINVVRTVVDGKQVYQR